MGSEQAGVEMYSPVKDFELGAWRLGRLSEPAGIGQLRAKAIVIEGVLIHALPQVVEGHVPGRDAILAERMEETVAGMAPVGELDAEFEGAVGGAHDFTDVEAGRLKILLNSWNCGFADPDRTDGGRFDQGDVEAERLEAVAERCGGHPSRCAATGDNDTFCHADRRNIGRG
ncbi:hypothetical protein ABAC460_14495 [Asticcacaulis sp. AC460]|nr:hypothetical protein ABAC460_14495 [Asticcacaulis sp. AC460]